MDRCTVAAGIAHEAIQRGDYVTAVDHYWRAFEAAALEEDGQSVELRWVYFGYFCNIMLASKSYASPAKAHIKNLKSLSRRVGEAPIYRAKALYILGMLIGRKGKDEDAADYFREAVQVVDSANPNEKQQLVFANPDFVRAEKLLSETKQKALDILNKLDHSRPWSDWENFSTSPRGVGVPKDRPDLMKRTAVGGDKCDTCGKTPRQAGLARLQVCQRCKLACYCSRDCQRKAWKAGHKLACRKPDEIKVGDVMQLVDIPVSGQLVQVLSRDNQENHWLVQLLIVPECPPSVFPAKHLRHIRPEK